MRRSLLQAVLAAMLVAGCQSQGAAQAESRSQRPFTVKEIAKFSTPWAMAFLPGSGVRLTNAALLTEREGRLWLVDVGSGKRTAVSGVPSVVVAGQGGLGDVMGGPLTASCQPLNPHVGVMTPLGYVPPAQQAWGGEYA